MVRASTFIGLPCGKGHDGTRYQSTGMCVACSNEWYKRNKEKKAIEYLERRESIKERKSLKAKEYYQKNREKILAQQKKYYEENKGRWIVKAHRRRDRGMPSHVSIKDIQKLQDLQKNKCPVCQTQLTKYHIDHITPLSKNGKHEFNNLQLLCPTCNLNKHAKDPVTFMQSKGYLL